MGRIDIEDLVGMQEIADALRVKYNTVQVWRRRNIGFPDPLRFISGNPVWDWHDVYAWSERR